MSWARVAGDEWSEHAEPSGEKAGLRSDQKFRVRGWGWGVRVGSRIEPIQRTRDAFLFAAATVGAFPIGLEANVELLQA